MGIAAATSQRLMEASLARSAYCDASVFADEQRLAMATSWVCVGRSDSIGPAPGCYRLTSVAADRVLVVRDNSGALGAFANRCMHRGTELVDSTSPSVASACFDSVIRCPYHFWAYGFDGSLRASPWVDDIDPAQFGLHRFAIDEWGGFAFVRLAADGPSLVDEIGAIAARISRFPLDQLVVGGTVTYDVASNWKVLAENYNECYHCGPVHPELCELVPSFRVRGGASLDWEQGIPHRPGADTFTASGNSERESFPGLNDAERVNHFGELIYPNLLLSLSRDHVAAFILQPIAADRTLIECQLLFHPDEVGKNGFDAADAVEFWHMVNLQDWGICERVQRGMTSRTFGHGWYAPMEVPSLDIRRWWTSKMNA
ncbi:MAG: aromatic ring-hydroxylating dioxygenase subunit alpha [Ilumatobacteraceae bacterium]|nr:aromatic ring-hydroxylating dioxygenase subunit alpha [Ilumatobacteraceae bacterium]